jgi:hypothetical protein
VETFSDKAIVLHRHDADRNGHRTDVVYAGQVSDDRLIGVTVNGVPVSGIDASWGIALTTLPGSNAERDARKAATLDSSSGSAVSSAATPNSSSGGNVSSAATPPSLPGEEQPELPQDGYVWTPGYWYWRDQGYFWIPGAWLRPPRVGWLWTPAYWGSVGTVFVFHPGYWGSTVGFYGGINYGHGYFGSGYSGGRWIGNSFVYNSTVNHLNPAVAHQTYAEYVPSQDSRGVFSYTRGSTGAAAVRPASRNQSMSQSVARPATTTTVQRTTQPAPKPMEIDRPAAVAKMPNGGAAPKLNHAAPTRAAAPVKQ